MEIRRSPELALLKQRLQQNPAVALLGPRQCGKTTLAKQLTRGWTKAVQYFDCENPRDLNRLADPLTALQDAKGLVVIDEIQRVPELFPVLRVLLDRPGAAKFLMLSSASRDLIRQSSETLAGRISYVEIGGFSGEHVAASQLGRLWIRGGFPRSFLARTEQISYQWRQDFIATFLERDISNLGMQIPARSLGRCWAMLAHYHGQLFHASEIGRSLELSDHSVRRYLDLLCGTFMIRQLKPWHYNTNKRLIKSPKIYFRDSGLLHALLSLEERSDVLSHPKLGASWEGFALEETIRRLRLSDDEVFFWGVHTGAELDMVFEKKGRLYGVEVKYSQAPAVTPSMRAALAELSLTHVWVIYPGAAQFPLARHVTAMPLSDISSDSIKKSLTT